MGDKPTFLSLLRSPVLLLAFGFGSGLSKKAPGTVGSLVALGIWILIADLALIPYIIFLIISGLIGVYICGVASEKLGVHDHGGIVWDEFVGLWIAMICLPVSWLSIILGFGLFRFFDIVKPWPISWADKNVSGGLGIMLDDVFAGFAAAASIALIQHFGIF